MRDLTALVISLSVLLVLSVLWMHACGICAQPQPRGTVHPQKRGGAYHPWSISRACRYTVELINKAGAAKTVQVLVKLAILYALLSLQLRDEWSYLILGPENEAPVIFLLLSFSFCMFKLSCEFDHL